MAKRIDAAPGLMPTDHTAPGSDSKRTTETARNTAAAVMASASARIRVRVMR